MALIEVADGDVAAVVTTLEMDKRPPLRPFPASSLRLVAWPRVDPARYRALFARVGTPWLWYSRLALTDDALVAIIHDAKVEVHAVIDRAGIEVGMLELDRRAPKVCEIAYFGLIRELSGKGLGRWLMAEALARAWAGDVERLRVNTCTLDHPHALGFYQAQGFVAVRRTLETFPDPRLLGLVPADAAPHVPCLGARRSG
jgi:GNAT superfamily N-acetyltransferase